MQIIDGKAIATQIKEQIKAEVATMTRKPSLVAVLVGNDGASETYVKNKEQACAYIGFKSEVRKFSAEITQTELIAEIERLNTDSTVDGFIVQMPLPSQIDEAVIINSIDPRKDVDGFHPVNVGRMILGLPSYVAATPLGILELLRHTKIETSGKKCVVIGRSNIVGRPISNLLSAKGWDCTVTLCHSRTTGLKEICLEADIIIAALGVPHFVKADMVKSGAVIIDVGISRIPSETTKNGWKMAGDVDFDNVATKCSYITPVPGGVGPMTIISLMKNTLLAAKGEIYK